MGLLNGDHGPGGAAKAAGDRLTRLSDLGEGRVGVRLGSMVVVMAAGVVSGGLGGAFSGEGGVVCILLLRGWWWALRGEPGVGGEFLEAAGV